jgi:preprotein translocase subunit SecA
MIGWIFKKIVGSQNQRILRKFWPLIGEINRHEQSFQQLSDDALRAKVAGWKERLGKIQDLQELGKELDALLPEAFAAVKNAARRMCGQSFPVTDLTQKWEMVHFDVQLIGGIALHKGMISEMATGEGKTLVATLATFLNALTGRGVHVVTVNDYLARRDAEWMGHLYKFLGLTVGCIQNDQSPQIRQQMYRCDITYGTASEFGFDYLRDNGLATSPEYQVQRGYFFAIVDEVDSVLVDEARTPLIISGPVTVDTHHYEQFKPLVESLVKQQTLLSNRLVSEAKDLLAKEGDNEARVEAGRMLFKVKLGNPRQKGLLRMMEEPDLRKLVEQTELQFFQDTRKEELFALKEELFYTIDEKTRDADLTEKGREFLDPNDPDSFTLPDLATAMSEIEGLAIEPEEKNKRKTELQEKTDAQSQRMHNISQLLRAYSLYEKEVHYTITETPNDEGEIERKVVIVDENTGRTMPGRRWSDGLHQAVEAKEGVKIDKESQTLATITIQNFFRQYHKLAGMTGTAETEANEFKDIYALEVLVIPTNRPNQRQDLNDLIFKTQREKYNAVVREIKAAHGRKQPILVGTASIEASEVVSRMLKREKIPHAVLNAKYHRQEAEIVARAGQAGMVTISTNMAGRGTDIKLGPGVAEVGGLYVLGTERHESRRIDRQLRGRCARQGDPGMSRFFVSFEDPLMRNFGSAERITSLMEKFGMEDGEEIEHPWLNKSVETAQKRVEQRNYMMRKHTLDYDDVMNQQREVIYEYRNEALHTEDTRALVMEVLEKRIPERVKEFLEEGEDDKADYDGLIDWFQQTFPLGLTAEAAALQTRDTEGNAKFLLGKVKDAYGDRVANFSATAVNQLERSIILTAIDRLWQEHLYGMDALRDGIDNWRHAQKDPLVEYKKAAFEMFGDLMEAIENEVLQNLFRSAKHLEAFENFLQTMALRQTGGGDGEEPRQSAPAPKGRIATGGPVSSGEGGLKLEIKRAPVKAGRNDPCPCGSGKKFKSCCGKPVGSEKEA